MLDRSIIVQPVITEKATLLNAQGKYVFLVKKGATKNEVRKAVRLLYKVEPTSVDMVNLPAKQKGFGRVRGKTQARRKAIVTLKAGDTITLQ
jgi:large subunit ribosomal protein L23